MNLLNPFIMVLFVVIAFGYIFIKKYSPVYSCFLICIACLTSVGIICGIPESLTPDYVIKMTIICVAVTSFVHLIYEFVSIIKNRREIFAAYVKGREAIQYIKHTTQYSPDVIDYQACYYYLQVLLPGITKFSVLLVTFCCFAYPMQNPDLNTLLVRLAYSTTYAIIAGLFIHRLENIAYALKANPTNEKLVKY